LITAAQLFFVLQRLQVNVTLLCEEIG